MTNFKHIFEREDALWIHSGEATQPHALLTSGNHSNGFFNASKIIQKPALLEKAAWALVDQVECKLLENPPTMVVGSAMGAITIAYEVAKVTSKILGRTVLSGFTERGENRSMNLKRFNVSPSDYVWVVEDVLTTGGTTIGTLVEVKVKGAQVLPFVGVLVNRSGETKLCGRDVYSLVSEHLPIWSPEKCPLCKEGSEAVRPKTHWKELTGNNHEAGKIMKHKKWENS